jgi:hypothetical protein
MGARIVGAAIAIGYFVWMYSFGKRRGWMALVEALVMTAVGAAATELMQPRNAETHVISPTVGSPLRFALRDRKNRPFHSDRVEISLEARS